MLITLGSIGLSATGTNGLLGLCIDLLENLNISAALGIALPPPTGTKGYVTLSTTLDADATGEDVAAVEGALEGVDLGLRENNLLNKLLVFDGLAPYLAAASRALFSALAKLLKLAPGVPRLSNLRLSITS